MGRKRGKKGTSVNPSIYDNATLREENIGKKHIDKSSILRMQHLQRLAVWAGGEARIPPLGAFLGSRLTTKAEASAIPLDHSIFLCQRCETVLQPGFNCTIRIEKSGNKGRWHKKACIPCKNSVVYTCHFCSHRNLKWGTAEGHLKSLIASRSTHDLDANPHCSTDRTKGNSENVVATRHAVHQDVGEQTPLKQEPASELKSVSPGEAAATGEILVKCPVAPLGSLVNTSQRKRNVSGSTPNKLPVGGNNSAITDSGKGSGGSSKRRRKAWSSLKEITENNELLNAKNISKFAIPFRM